MYKGARLPVTPVLMSPEQERTNMADDTPMQQFEQGAATIHQALRAALQQRGISGFYIARTAQGANIRPHDSTFIVETKDKTESLMFTREEIMDSAKSLDAFASAKVRVLTSRFTYS